MTLCVESNESACAQEDRSKWQRFKGVLAYDGYDFCGWQSQKSKQSVQDLLEWRLCTFFQCRTINVVGSSRTDAKVHANNQTFHVDLPIYAHDRLKQCNVDEQQAWVMKVLNSLPKTIHIKSIQCVPKTFHSRFSNYGKTYIYSIIHKRRCHPFEMRYFWNINEENKKMIHIASMMEASKLLIGKHNFRAFAIENEKHKITTPAFKGDTPSPFKHMKRIEIVQSGTDNCNIHIRMTCSGFLYKMARSIAGTLIEVGLGRLSVSQFESVFQSQTRSKQIITAPGHGLSIERTYYDQSEWQQIDNNM